VIFVITGTNGPPFDRLMRAVETIETDEALLVQHGPSSIRPANATCVDYLSLPETVERIRRARLVLTHCGVGTILTCLGNGKRPLVVPRRAYAGEVADDHQVELGQRLGREGLVVFVPEPGDIGEALRTAPDLSLSVAADVETPLIEELRAYLRRELREEASRGRGRSRAAARRPDRSA
jgi:UDP-N-acetylglucosamine transferase subunit ALG13